MYKKIAVLAIKLGAMVFLSSCGEPQQEALCSKKISGIPEGWEVSMISYTFKEFTFFEAVDKTKQLGLHRIGAYPHQQVNANLPGVKTGVDMQANVRRKIKKKIADAGIILDNYGVVGLPNDEAECRRVFDFAKDMCIETIVSEPPLEALDLIERLCEEYKIKMAIHNHPAPSRYGDPEVALKALKGRNKWIGICADVGHWTRSGLDAAEILKKYQGRIINLHFKDVSEFGKREAHDVVWGTGKSNVKAMLQELHRQNFKGSFIIEHEHNWLNSIPEIRQSLDYFYKVASEL